MAEEKKKENIDVFFDALRDLSKRVSRKSKIKKSTLEILREIRYGKKV